MASMGTVRLDPEPALRLVRGPRMFNKQLISICKAEGLPSTGVKAELQNRISSSVKKYALDGNVLAFERLKAMLENPQSILQDTLHQGQNQISVSPASSSPNVMGGNVNGYPSNQYRGKLYITFKSSPFYAIQQQIGEVKVCDIMAQHRNTVKIEVITVEHPVLTDIQTDPSLRVMIFCASDIRAGSPQYIQFPYQSEVKVNGGEIKANLRGLKNKPGSTRPVDITEVLRLKQTGYPNSVEMTYALTDKERKDGLRKFYMVINVVKSVSVGDLVDSLRGGKKISKVSVVNQMASKARDPDIVATSTVLSLKCPLSTLRIDLPCRSILCRHNQCFDATSYLQLQEQGPTWQCPICNNPAPFENLAVDEYVQNILRSTYKSADQITIEPDGTWIQHAKPASPTNMNASASDDEDLIEIKDTRVSALKHANTPTPSLGSTRSPQTASREPSTTRTASHASNSGKRPISQVIDLTLSEEEDDQPRPPKRQFNTSTYGTSPSIFPGLAG